MFAIDSVPKNIVQQLLNAGAKIEQKIKDILPLDYAVFSGKLEEGVTIHDNMLDIKYQANQKNIELLLLCFILAQLLEIHKHFTFL